jgi:hypothetical protein
MLQEIDARRVTGCGGKRGGIVSRRIVDGDAALIL